MSEVIGDLLELGIEVKATGSTQQKVKCPKCSSERRDKRDKSLSVNIKEGVYRCHYCMWTGCAAPNGDELKYAQPTPSPTETLSEEVVEFWRNRGIQKTTLIANKITEEDTWMPSEDEVVKTMVFNYYQNGILRNKKYRTLNKGFKLVKDAKLLFYNIDNLIGQNEAIITEGEGDTLSFFEAGIQNVVSVPNGANRGLQKLEYLDNCINYFDDIEKIYLAVDADESGESLFQELARRLGKEKCYRVYYPGGCKDANEVLMEHGVDAVKDLIDNAKPIPLEGVVDIDSETEAIMAMYNNGIERGEELGVLGEKFDQLCTFQTSRLYILSGIPGHGKSSILEDISIILAGNKGWKFGVFSPEHFPLSYMTYKYAEIITGKPFFEGASERMTIPQLKKAIEFVKDNFHFIRPKDEMFTLDNILEIAGNLVKRHGIKGLIIDPWNTIQHDFGGKSETQYTEDALNKITLFKQKYDIAVFLVAHPKKMRKVETGERKGLYEVPSLYDIAGSSNFYNKADMGMCVYRDFKDELTYLYMQKVKYRNLGENGMCTFKYNKLNNRFEWAEKADDGTNDIRILKPRYRNLLNTEGEQIEIKAVAPNTEFENEEDEWDQLPF